MTDAQLRALLIYVATLFGTILFGQFILGPLLIHLLR